MAFKVNRNDLEIIRSIAEYRLLTVAQIAALHHRNERATRRRFKELREAGFIHADTAAFGRGRGRPESFVSLTGQGVALLKDNELLGPDVPADHVAAAKIDHVQHQALLNWFRIHLTRMARAIPELQVEFLAPTSPYLSRTPDDQPSVFDRVQPAGSDEPVGFLPDGVFSITDTQEAKTLLFFLEVDMSTETLASHSGNPGDFRQKVLNYQAYFRSEGYKRYEDTWNCRLNGFRLLVLANSDKRRVSLCKLVRAMRPSDFIWLTDEARLFDRGVSASIWARGGQVDSPLRSIVTTDTPCPPPTPILKTTETPS